MIKAVRGTRDLLPPETALWNRVEATVRDVFRAYNFQEIRTPIFEDTALFSRSVGEETDIVSKEMYTWREGQGEDALLAEWLRGRHGASIFEPPKGVGGGPWQPDLLLEIDGKILMVEAKHRVTLAALEQITAYSQLLLKVIDRVIEKVFIYPAGAPLPIGVQQQANGRGIELQGVEIDLSQSLTLRPENTAGVVRAYIEHKLWERGLNKL